MARFPQQQTQPQLNTNQGNQGLSRYDRGYIDGLRAAANEIRTHWDYITAVAVRKQQAENSADKIEEIASAYQKKCMEQLNKQQTGDSDAS